MKSAKFDTTKPFKMTSHTDVLMECFYGIKFGKQTKVLLTKDECKGNRKSEMSRMEILFCGFVVGVIVQILLSDGDSTMVDDACAPTP